MSLNSQQHVSIYSAIDAAMTLLQLENPNEVLEDFARWAYEAETKIGSSDTYKRFECELEVEDYQACVPDNFIYLNALKIGETYLDVTKRDFRMFNKAKSSPVVTTPERYLSGNKIVCNPGQAGSIAYVFSGVFLVGDLIILTITNNDCGNLVTNSFQHLVVGGETTPDILTDFAAQVNAILLPYSAIADTMVSRLIITGRDATVNFNLLSSTTSITGTISNLVIQRRVAPREGDDCDTCDDTPSIVPAKGSNNLANRSAVNLNNQATGKLNVFGGSNAVYSIINNKIFFNTIENGKVGISYMGIYLDEDGWPMVKNNHIKAVSTYLIYMYKYRDFISGKTPQYVIVQLDRDWTWECGQARGNDEMPDANEYKYLANQHMQLLPLPNKNNF